MPPKMASATVAKPVGTTKPPKPTDSTGPSAKRRKAVSVTEAKPDIKESKSRKRKSADDEDNAADSKPTKRARNAPENTSTLAKAATSKHDVPKKQAPRTVTGPKPKKALAAINEAPSQILDVYVFGEGSNAELGLGAGLLKDVMEVKRPRLNPRLGATSIGVVQVAVGGMHCAVLTHDNKILTWGVNDQGALGRKTDEGPLKDMDEESDEDEDDDSDSDEEAAMEKAKAKAAKRDSGLNASEAEPREVDQSHFPEGTAFAQLIAGDSNTFALTTTGLVYGWGTFRGNDGILGFRSEGPKTQLTPILIPELKNITSLATGTNHVLALNNKGSVFAWGAGEQNQLARRVVARTAIGALVPREFGLRKKIVHIGCGDYHSYAVDASGAVYAWGLNSFAQCGGESDGSGDTTNISVPTIMESLRGFNIQQIDGGSHHAIALTTDGKVLVWGRVDNKQGGIDLSTLPADSYYKSEDGRIRYLTSPATVPALNGNGSYVATGGDTCAAITKDGKAYTWGFNDNYQTGQGKVDDIAIAQLVDNTAVRGKTLVFAGIGGQFGVFGGIHSED